MFGDCLKIKAKHFYGNTEAIIYLYILTLAVAVVGNRKFVTAFLASSLFEST